MAKTIMLQGTSSHVGKSIITAALCRIFLQDGLQPAPFKSQNMALNSFVTHDGGEMGRAQVVQAEAAGLSPRVQMNPVLLKPTGDNGSQVIVLGRPVGNMSAADYHEGYSRKLLGVIAECLNTLKEEFDIVVIEGAGSPAEINLKENDIANMRIARLAEAPVLLIADIDRGGSLAAVVGTLELLDADERGLVKGIIFNKFRGNLALFAPALKFIEQKTGKPVVGVIPFLDRMDIDDEDSVSLEDKQVAINREIEIAVLRLPHISNFTDFAALSQEADVSLRYVRPGQKLGKPDLVILPGSKNTLEDMHYLVQQGYDKAIRRLVAQQVPVIGICGGYQLLGKSICDPQQVESGVGIVAGLGLIDAATIFVAEKVTQQVVATCAKLSFLEMDFSADELTGYEIHMGVTEVTGPGQPAFTVINRSNMELSQADGFVRPDGLVMGTYLHGIFDNDGFRRRLVNILRQRKGLAWVDGKSTAGRKEKQYNRLADHVRQHLNMEQIYQMLKMKL